MAFRPPTSATRNVNVNRPCLFDPRCPISTAAASVLGALGHPTRDARAWQPADGSGAVLVVSDRVQLVAQLRRAGFRGPVIVLYYGDDLRAFQRHRVLLFGTDCVFAGRAATDVRKLAEAARLLPILGPDVLKMVQQELTIPPNFERDRVAPCVARLRETGATAELRAEARELVARATAWSPLACHAVAEIDGTRCSIGAHFGRALDVLDAGDARAAADRLERAFAAWRAALTTHGDGTDE
jgi:hypothetical protein